MTTYVGTYALVYVWFRCCKCLPHDVIFVT